MYFSSSDVKINTRYLEFGQEKVKRIICASFQLFNGKNQFHKMQEKYMSENLWPPTPV